MAKNLKNTVTFEEAKNYCAQRRKELLTNVLNTKITIPNGDEGKVEAQSLSDCFTVGPEKQRIKVLDHLLQLDRSPTEGSVAQARAAGEAPPEPVLGFAHLLKKQHEDFFKADAAQQKKLQQEETRRQLLRGDMATYQAVEAPLNTHRDRALAQLDENYKVLSEKLTEALDEIKGYFFDERGGERSEQATLDAIQASFGVEDEGAARTLAEQLAIAYKKSTSPVSDKKDAVAPLDQAKAALKKNLKDTQDKEKHEIKRLYQQRLNNLKKIMTQSDAMIAFRDQQRLVGRMDRRLLQTDDTDSAIDRRHSIDFSQSNEFAYRAREATLEQEKAQGRGHFNLPSSKSPGILGTTSLITIEWQYNKSQDTYHFSCNLSALKNTADKETAVRGLISSSIARGATWVDVSGIGDEAFLNSTISGTFSDTQGGIKNLLFSSGMAKKMSLMAVAVEEAAFRGIKAENIRGVIIGPQNPKLLEAYQAGVQRRIAVHKSNGTFSNEANRAAAVALNQYSEVGSSFLHDAYANGFHVSNQVNERMKEEISRQDAATEAAFDQMPELEKIQTMAVHVPVLGNQVQKELDDFVRKYGEEEDDRLPKKDLLTLRANAFLAWAEEDKKNNDPNGTRAQERYQYWKENQTDAQEKILQSMEPLEQRLEDKKKKKGKDKRRPREDLQGVRNNDADSSENEAAPGGRPPQVHR